MLFWYKILIAWNKNKLCSIPWAEAHSPNIWSWSMIHVVVKLLSVAMIVYYTKIFHSMLMFLSIYAHHSTLSLCISQHIHKKIYMGHFSEILIKIQQFPTGNYIQRCHLQIGRHLSQPQCGNSKLQTWIDNIGGFPLRLKSAFAVHRSA